MTEIGVERLRARRDQEHEAHDHQAGHAVRQDEPDAEPWVERQENARVVDQMDEAANRECHEPDQRYGPEELRHLGGPARLHAEQHHQDGQGDWQNGVLHLRRDQLQALHGRQHRDRGRDDRIAVEEGGTGHAEGQDQRRAALGHRLALRHQRERPALALVVDVEENQHVLERHHEQQRPGHQRQDAEHCLLARCGALRRCLHRLLQGVEGRGADVAVDNADGAQRQRPELLVLGAVPGIPRRGGLWSHVGQLLDCCRAPDAPAKWARLIHPPYGARKSIGATSQAAAVCGPSSLWIPRD